MNINIFPQNVLSGLWIFSAVATKRHKKHKEIMSKRRQMHTGPGVFFALPFCGLFLQRLRKFADESLQSFIGRDQRFDFLN